MQDGMDRKRADQGSFSAEVVGRRDLVGNSLRNEFEVVGVFIIEFFSHEPPEKSI